MRRWLKWPQTIALNRRRSLQGARASHTQGVHVLKVIRACAVDLCGCFDPPLPLSKVVVFYPKRFKDRVNSYASTARKNGDPQYRGLIVSATTSLKWGCQAFLIEDVKNHRTPADAYFVMLHKTAAKGPEKPIDPNPLYTKRESKIGKEIHE